MTKYRVLAISDDEMAGEAPEFDADNPEAAESMYHDASGEYGFPVVRVELVEDEPGPSRRFEVAAHNRANTQGSTVVVLAHSKDDAREIYFQSTPTPFPILDVAELDDHDPRVPINA